MNKNVLVVVADGSRARLFVGSKGEEGLQETQDLVDISARTKPGDLVADESGHGQNRVGGGRYTLQPSSDERTKSRQRFARTIAEHVSALSRERLRPEVLIAASPGFLGVLRKELSEEVRQQVTREIDKDWTTLGADQICCRLSSA